MKIRTPKTSIFSSNSDRQFGAIDYLFKTMQWGAIALLVGVLGSLGLGQVVRAEGSRDLVRNGGSRPFTEWRTTTTGGIKRRTLLNVYAKAGETIYLGSSAVGVAAGNIVLWNPGANVDVATPNLNCNTAQPGAGVLDTRAKELVGPLPSVGGYTPCIFTPTTAGVYQVAFYGPSGPSSNIDGAGMSGVDTTSVNSPPIDANQRSGVSMWDITVRNSTTPTTNILGRVFTDAVALFMGNNNRLLKSDLYVLTKDGYRYQTRLNGLDPNGFIFFANDQGLFYPNGQPSYRSGIKAGDNSVTSPLDGGLTLQPPVHKMFFNPPDSESVTAINFSSFPVAPPVPMNFKFVAGAGGSGNQTIEAVGGVFTFNLPIGTTYQIVINTSNNFDGLGNPIYNPSGGDRILEGKVTDPSGLVTVVWDGKDGNGVIVPALPGNAPYAARVISRSGEYHFPMIDAENNPTGFTIERLNTPIGYPVGNPTTIYFDERNFTSTNNVPVNLGCTSSIVPICDGRDGVISSGGSHIFTGTGASGYGNEKVVDTWVYYPSAPVSTPLVITKTTVPKVSGTKSVKFFTDADSSGTVTVNDIVEYTITYTNNSTATANATSFIIQDLLPSQLSFVSALISAQTTGNTITLNSGYTGTGTLTNLTNVGTLRPGDSITIKVKAKITDANSGNPIPNQATATFSTADNPTVSAGQVVTDSTSSATGTAAPTVGNEFPQLIGDRTSAGLTIENGNDPTNPDDDEPTLITVVASVPVNPPKLILLKRITRINGGTTAKASNGSSLDLTTVVAQPDNPNTPEDESKDSTIDSSNAPTLTPWPAANYPKGAIDAGVIKTSDTIEYTIYFLSSGGKPVTNANLCDWVPENTIFEPNSYGVGQGIQLAIGSIVNTLTNVPDGDRGVFFNPNTVLPTTYPTGSTSLLTCRTPAGSQGAVVVNLVRNILPAPNNQLPNATAAGNPGNSYGFIRFVSKVK